MRSFIALDLDDKLKDMIAEWAVLFYGSLEGRLTPKHQLHSTLFFFENFSKDLEKLKKDFLEIPFESFDINIIGFDYFSFQKKPTILYLKYHSEVLLVYYQQIKRLLDYMDLSYDKKPFREHITVVRIKSVKDIGLFKKTIVELNEKINDLSSKVLGISFYQSRLTPSGPIYNKLFSLGGIGNEC